MSRVLFLLALSSVAVAQPPKGATHQIKLDEHTFTFPVGFTIEKVADRPLVDRPIVASFDDRGRLYVADSSGSNEKVVEQLKNPTHRIVRLDDTDGDGKFDKSTVFADKMMFPEGILWHRGHVYCAAPPHIWKLTDTDDDGKVDKREVWFDGKTLTGCANDLHGPYLGPDGWIYWCKGAFAKQEYTLPNGKKFTTRASHIFRARPDGTGIEPVMTGGMDNPVDVAFLPNGERFFTTTFFQHPAAGKRDGLIHAVYGGIYGKDHDVTRDPDHKWTSPNLMPVMTHMGPAAPCGLHCYESDAFGKEYTSNLFACQFNLRKVSRHILKPIGATYETEDSDFVVSDNTDFHPTDVIEDADGSLLIVNTGGWYKLCCPSSQLVKADVLGAIYRVRRTDNKYERKWLPNEIKIAKGSELPLIDDFKLATHPAVRDRLWDAIKSATKRVGRDYLLERLSIDLIKCLHTPRATQKAPTDSEIRTAEIAVWTLCQANGELARDYIRQAIKRPKPDVFMPPPESVVVAAIQSASIWRDRKSVPALIEQLENPSLVIRRASAEALGFIGEDMAVGPLIKAVADKDNDRALDHAITFALIELDNREYLKNCLDTNNNRVRRACLAALDQLGEKLDPKVVLAAMKSDNAELKETAQWIIGRHPEWADQLLDVFADRLADPKGDDLVPQLAKFASTPKVQALLAGVVSNAEVSEKSRIVAMQSMAAAGLKTPPDSWYKALEEPLVAQESKPLILAALSTLRALPVPKKVPESLVLKLHELSRDTSDRDVIAGAIASIPGGAERLQNGDVSMLLTCVDSEAPQSLRGVAAEAIARSKFNTFQLLMIVAGLGRVGPLEIDRVLSVFTQSKDDEVGTKLVAALNTDKLRPSLRVDSVKERIKNYPAIVHKEAETLYAALNKDYAAQRKKLDDAVETLKTGDIRRGQAIFNSTKTSCIACHTIGYVGGKQGPDLTRIGGIRTERDLLEAILFPSASFVRSYETVVVTTKDMKTYSGVPKKDAPDEMILVIAADKEVRILREEIEEVRPGKVSIMPDGLDKQLSPQELADLIAFLRNCK
jgi:putative membrane-bound dehydrogenase-like protein